MDCDSDTPMEEAKQSPSMLDLSDLDLKKSSGYSMFRHDPKLSQGVLDSDSNNGNSPHTPLFRAVDNNSISSKSPGTVS